MSTPEITVRYYQPAIRTRSMCEAQDTLEGAAVDFELTYPQGREQDALRALDEAYADLKRQIESTVSDVRQNENDSQEEA